MSQRKRLQPTIKPKKLTGLDILKESSKYDVLRKITLEDGRTTDIYTNLSNVKVKEMLDSFFVFCGEYINARQEEGHSIDDGELLDFLNLHMILFFTTIAFKVPENIDGKIDFFNKLLRVDAVEEVFEQFDKEDISKVYDRFYKTAEAYEELIKTNKEFRDKFRDTVKEMGLENQEIIEELFLDVDDSDDDGDTDIEVENVVENENGEVDGE